MRLTRSEQDLLEEALRFLRGAYASRPEAWRMIDDLAAKIERAKAIVIEAGPLRRTVIGQIKSNG